MKHNHQDHIRHSFDSYCKKIIHNEAVNYQKKQAKLREHQVSANQLNKDEYQELYSRSVTNEGENYFSIYGLRINIKNESLFEAIDCLKLGRKQIILLFYFVGLTDKEIGELQEKSLGSVWYQRQEALEDLQQALGVSIHEESA